MFSGGYTGKILRVNLTDGKISVEPLDEEVARNYLGGRGLGIYLLYKELKEGIDPLSPDNKICFLAGPLQGTMTPYTPKFVIVNKSPLSGSFTRTVTGGGAVGPELKYAGYDALIVEGKAKAPVYIWIDDDKVQIRDATPHWGKMMRDTESSIRKELGDDSIKIIPIGPAGENLVRFAGVIPESRGAARGGPGAVMGSKNLKAVAVRGTGSVCAADIKKFKDLLEEAYAAIKADPVSPDRINFSTLSSVPMAYRVGIIPILNYSGRSFEGIAGLLPQAAKEKILVHNESCFGCALPCGKTSMIKDGLYKGIYFQGPQYETVGLLGTNCGIGDITEVARANYLCNEYGLDTISTGNTIAFAIECYQRGLITDKDTDGLRLKFGDGELILELIHKIANRDGFGDLMAEGVKRLSEKIGQESEKFAMHSKGQEFAAFDPRTMVGMGLVYATSSPGANHSYGPTLRVEMAELKDPFTAKEKGRVARQMQNQYCLQDSMIYCSFSRYGFNHARRMSFFEATTGWKYSEDEIVNIADRIYTLERLFNMREGFTKEDDTLPWRSLYEPKPEDPGKGQTVPLEPMLNDYYSVRGWDENGVPKKETLDTLGLDEL